MEKVLDAGYRNGLCKHVLVEWQRRHAVLVYRYLPKRVAGDVI
jgi:hypothetical protein